MTDMEGILFMGLHHDKVDEDEYEIDLYWQIHVRILQ